jgi:hypothetical protein
MKKLLLILFPLFLFSNVLCQSRILKSLHFLDSGKPSWILDNKYSVIYSEDIPEDLNYSKRNPTLGLYFYEHNLPIGGSVLPMKIRNIRNNFRFAMNGKEYIKGSLKQAQVGLEFARFTSEIPENWVVSSGCCVMAGLSVGGDRYLESEFIQRILEMDSDHFSNIGARFVEVDGGIYVYRVNPFFTDNPFLEGDKILKVDGEKPKSFHHFLMDTLLSPKDRIMFIEIEREGSVIEVVVESETLKGGGILSDTFMENLGVWFDKDLYVENIHKDSIFSKKGLKNRFHLMKINDIVVETPADVQDLLSQSKTNMPKHFQFIFKHGDRDISIYLRTVDKYEGGSNNGFQSSFGSFGISSWGQPESDINNSSYDIYNELPLGEYLSY